MTASWIHTLTAFMSQRIVLVSIEVTVLAILVWSLIRLFRIKSARFRAMLWLVVMLKPILGLVIGAPVPVLQVQNPISTIRMSSLDSMVEEQLAQDQIALARNRAKGSEQIAGSFELAGSENPFPEAAGKTDPQPLSAIQSINLTQWLTYIWMLGFVWMAVRIYRDRKQIQQLVDKAQLPSHIIQQRYIELAKEMGISNPPALKLSSSLESPALVGHSRPTVLLPQWMSEPWTEQTNWALRHELQHYKSLDPWGLLVRQISRILFYFHPIVWWVGKNWEAETELACDRALIAGKSDAQDYAKQLYGILEAIHGKRKLRMSDGLFASRTQLSQRITALLSTALTSPAHLGKAGLTVLLILATTTFSVGLIFAQAPQQSQAPVSTLSEEQNAEIAQKVSKAQSSMRKIHVALECYFIDNNQYPTESMHVLTTPIAYLTAIPTDPFNDLQPMKWGMPAPDDRLVLYSIGPDEKDNLGTLDYDPTNGTISKGDIVRVIYDPKVNSSGYSGYMKAYPAFNQYSTEMGMIDDSMKLLEGALKDYCWKKRKFPPQLSNLLKPEGILEQLPEDPFNHGQTFGYNINTPPVTVTLYSVGPDGIDNGGQYMTGLSTSHPKGDLRRIINIEIPGTSNRQTNDAMMKALLKIQEETGEDNAMIYYQRQALLGLPLLKPELLNTTLHNGWSAQSEPLKDYFEIYSQAFDLVRQGVRVHHAVMPDPDEYGAATPVPNFLAAQVVSKLMVTQGLYFESKGEYEKALDNYLTTLEMGAHYGGENALLIGGLVSIAVKNIALEPIQDLVSSGNLSTKQLQRTKDRLTEIESMTPSFPSIIQSEGTTGVTFLRDAIKKAKENPDNIEKIRKDTGLEEKKFLELLNSDGKDIDRVEKHVQEAVTFYTQPLWVQNWQEWKEIQSSYRNKNKIFDIMAPDYPEASVRFGVTRAKMHLARTRVDLELAKIKTGEYPARLVVTGSQQLTEAPLDPFTGRMLQYERMGDSYLLYSVGPDKTDQSGKIKYDPKNGTMSGGDIVR